MPVTQNNDALSYLMENSANNMISNISGNLGYSTDSNVLVLWGQPGNMSQRAEMALFGIKNQEPAAVQPKPVFGFDFTPLRGR